MEDPVDEMDPQSHSGLTIKNRRKKFMKRKQLAALAAATVMALSLVGCGGGSSTSTETKAAEAGATTAAVAETDKKADDGELIKKVAHVCQGLGDKSFSDSLEGGMKVLREKGWDCKTVECGDETKADKYEDMMLDVIDEGYHYIVASSTFRDVMLKLAKEYPENQFIIVDDSMDEADIPDNVALIFYAQNEGSYIVGQLAAGMSESGVVAVNVGMDTPVIADFVTGFIDGAQAYDPDIKIVKAAVGSWTDPAKMKELCLTQARDKQADVFYQVAGASGAGLFEACKELGTWAIGVDSDQYAYYKESENPELADIILTSMLKNVGDSVVAFFEKVENGEAEWGKQNSLGLSDNAVGYVDNDFFEATVPEELRAVMTESKEKIASGELKAKSYYDFANEDEYQKLLDSVAP